MDSNDLSLVMQHPASKLFHEATWKTGDEKNQRTPKTASEFSIGTNIGDKIQNCANGI